MSGAVESYLGQYRAAKAVLPGAGLPWLAKLREDGIERFASLGFPSRKVEAWKYTNLGPIRQTRFESALLKQNGGTAVGLPAIAVDQGAAHRLAFVDGRFRADLSNFGALPDGVELTSLGRLLATEPAALEGRIGAGAAAEQDGVLALTTALKDDGFVLRIKRGVVVEDPIEILFVGAAGTGPVAYFPRNLVVAEAGSTATIVEDHLGQRDRIYFANGATEIFLEAGAALRHYKIQDESLGAFHLHGTYARLDRDASYESFVLSLGGRISRNEIRVVLDGPGVECQLNGAYAARGGQHVDHTTAVDHAKPRTTSRQLYKGVLDDTARAVFQGTVLVRPDAQKADGRQLSHALLLSDKAEIDAKPALNIWADDVKCSHGATAGALDDEALFYLRCRGIDEAEARRVLIRAFLDDVIDTIGLEVVRTAFRDKASSWLAAR